MGRTRKGLPVHGWVLLDKPAGMGSTECVGLVRRVFGAQKAGHAGTLDPDATGLLAIALGEATKTVPLIADAMKSYRFRVAFGAATGTDDAAGAVIARSDLRPTDGQIDAALDAFRGNILQVPPQVSAVKVEGQRAYDLARDGVEMDLAARPLFVERLVMTGRPDADHADLEMVCGKGGYVRSIARDLGAALGCLGHVAWLRRVWSGPFHTDAAVSPDALLQMADEGTLAAALHPLEDALSALPELACALDGATRLRHGNPGRVLGHLPWGETAWASDGGQAIAVGVYRDGELHPNRVFNR